MISLLTQCDETTVEVKGVDGIVRAFRQVRPKGLVPVDLLKTDVRLVWDAARAEIANEEPF